jgi:hypothetical protein
VVVLVVGFGAVYAGLFNVAADDPHWRLTHRLIELTRERSIAVQAHDVGAPPALNDPKFIAAGGQEYAEMCTGCHLAPGMEETEMRTGLYPKPPNLAEPGRHRSPAETFWIIKHGLKMTGMPAWGLTHDDQRLWSMVAFLQQLPTLSPTQYAALVREESSAEPAQGNGTSDHPQGDSAPPREHEEAKGQQHHHHHHGKPATGSPTEEHPS